MHLTTGEGHVNGAFVDENPQTGQGTGVEEKWLNMVQEELKAILDEAGIEPDIADNTQVVAAILQIISENTGLTIATQAEAEAGTENTKAMSALRVAQYLANQIGTNAGQLAVLDGTGKFPNSVLPSLGGYVGQISIFPTEAAVPVDHLVLNGASFDQATYPELYTALGNSSNLPDWRGYFPRMADLGRGVDSGRTVGSFQADDYKSHAHRGRVPSDFRYVTSGSNKVMMGNFQPSESGTLTYPESSSYSGGTETRPKNVAVVFAIKAE